MNLDTFKTRIRSDLDKRGVFEELTKNGMGNHEFELEVVKNRGGTFIHACVGLCSIGKWSVRKSGPVMTLTWVGR